ncbi:hypothetical protein J1N35_036577 [Gossypium stocksii]|uniref:Uncharacterized protein n=1 Tax=Gossypium stocksii TaxID=47602 RepID=A0A9D3UIC8_9ROSI|nr:hypothetical protein J1N35_036577 [Gossypium stocksii]
MVAGKGKGILGFPPGFPAKEHLIVSSIPNLGHLSMSSRGGIMETVNTSFRVDCPRFDGRNFRESYALSIFISNLKLEIGQYLRLFKPQSLMEGYNLARQVENIVCDLSKKGFSTGSGFSSPRPLFPYSRVQQGVGSSISTGDWCKVMWDKNSI